MPRRLGFPQDDPIVVLNGDRHPSGQARLVVAILIAFSPVLPFPRRQGITLAVHRGVGGQFRPGQRLEGSSTSSKQQCWACLNVHSKHFAGAQYGGRGGGHSPVAAGPSSPGSVDDQRLSNAPCPTPLRTQGVQVLPFSVDFQVCGRWAGPLWSDSTLWLPSASVLANSSRALRELLGRMVYRSW